MSHAGTGNVVVIMISYLKGREILDLVREGIPVRVGVAVGTRHVQELISGQSVVFVAIAFISMMIISLAWLIFYYVQRFLYTGSRLGSQSQRKETKKVIGQLPVHTVKQGEKGIDVDAENCAVCIENFKVKDVIRILPCKAASGDTEANGQLVDTLSMRKEPEPAVSVNPDASCSSPLCRSLGELEDAQEMPTPESPPGVVLAPELSLTLPDGDRSVGDNSASSPTSHAVLQGDATFKEDASENTVLLGE
ncbi:E3 ubiquitin-protein ligase RNF149 [Camelus dromedarius]|uniref:E3 ubiquitin-protein ligase RNF149 n=1 Tax=Camelus dromedarius TaxID=9838 RepID=A0A5N4CD03_CAMDR|nr:E3 ubiquitin-protein ligase RNF149 [Camelus dromedarius]